MLLTGFLLLAGALLTLANTPRFQPQVTLQDAAGKRPPRAITLPYISGKQRAYNFARYTLTFNHHPELPSRFRIIPDNCILSIWLNDAAVDMNSLPPQSLCDHKTGVVLDLSSQLHPKENTLIIEIQNKNGPYGLDVSPVYTSPVHLPVVLFLMGAGICFIYSLSQKMRFDRLTALIWCASLPYFGFWLYGTSPLHYMHDVYGHLGYFRHLISNWDEPYNFMGQEHWQPPTYYYALAAIQKLAGQDGFVTIRIFSLLLYQLFCFFGIRSLNEAITTRGTAYYVGILLIVFWPSSVLFATRINNDIPLYTCWAASFYYLTRWYRTQEMASLRKLVVCLSLALMVKTNALIPIAILGVVGLYAPSAGRTKLRSLLIWQNLPTALFFVLGALVNTGRHWHNTLTNKKSLTSLHFGQEGTTTATWQHFLSFDLSYYLQNPFNTLREEPSFANNFLKTMLFGEFSFGHPEVATILGVFLTLFLAILMASALARIRQWKKITGDALPYLCGIIVPVLSVMAFFAIKKLTVCQEFRFAVPMIIPLAILYVSNLNALKQQSSLRVLYWLGLGTGAALPVGGVLFYLVQYF
jgi:hypothetical protein